MKSLPLTLLLFSSVISTPVFALRCGNLLVDVGNYKQMVLNKCGEPESIDSHLEKRAVANNGNVSQYSGNGSYPNDAINYGQQQYFEIDVLVEEWLYNFGRSRFQQLLRFENGKLIDIKELGYGY